jgi:hypothetical protein
MAMHFVCLIHLMAHSVEEAAAMLAVHSFSVYLLIRLGRLNPRRALRGKLLVPRCELLKLLNAE